MKDDHEANNSANPCETYLNMFSPAIDDELLPHQREEFDRHLQNCPRCSSEFDIWQNISHHLRSIPPVPAPEDFTSSVMAGIGGIDKGIDKRAPAKKMFSGFGRRWAAAAAGVLLMAGSMGLYGMFNMNPQGSEMAAGKKIPAVEQPLPETPSGPANKAGEGSSAGSAATPGTVKPGADSVPAGGAQQPPGPNKPVTGGKSGGSQAAQTPTPTPTPGANSSPTAPTALLSEKVTVNSTLVKIKSQDPAVVAEQALSLAQSNGAGAKYMVNQSTDSRTVVVLQISAPNKNAGKITGRLAGMGVLVENSSNNRDITSQYQQALAKRQELNELINSREDQDRQIYRDELEAVNMQINEWNEASKSTSIMFWIEK